MLETSCRTFELVSALKKPVSVWVVLCHISLSAADAAAGALKCFGAALKLKPISIRRASLL
jgi:hypothetical protein